MKNILKYTFATAILLVGMASCEDDEQNITDFVQEEVERGAVLRTIDLETDLPLATESAQFAVTIEEQDVEGGDLLESVDVYVTFRDNTDDDDSDSTGAITDEVFIETIPASAFTDGPFGLPRADISYSFDELREFTNIDSEDQLTGGDTFTIRLALNLTDGRTFSSDNAGGVITAGFFNSPFRYTATVSCPVPEEYFTGTYLMERISETEDPFFPSFGQAFDTQEVVVEANGASRGFDFVYYPNPEGFQFGQRLTIALNCGEFIVSGTAIAGTLGCDGTSIGQSQGDVDTSEYSLTFDDDEVIELSFEDFNPDAGCGTGSYDVTIRLTQQ